MQGGSSVPPDGLRLHPDGGVAIPVGLDLVEAVTLASVQIVLLLVIVGGHVEPVRPRAGDVLPDGAIAPLATVHVGAEGGDGQTLLAEVVAALHVLIGGHAVVGGVPVPLLLDPCRRSEELAAVAVITILPG